MYNKVFKNYQVNVGNPFQVKPAFNFQTVKPAEAIEESNIEKARFEEMETPEEIISNAKEEADMIVQEAKLEAVRLLEDTEREAQEIIQKVEEEARVKGYEDGFNEVKRQYEDLLQEAEFVRDHARVEYNDVLASIESDAVNIILDVAKKVIGTEITTNKDNILFLIRQAFEKCANKENVLLKVSPEDYDFISENKDKLLSMIEGIGELDIRKDTALKSGGCIVDTPYGSVDGGLQTKLKKIEEAFRQVITR